LIEKSCGLTEKGILYQFYIAHWIGTSLSPQERLFCELPCAEWRGEHRPPRPCPLPLSWLTPHHLFH